MPQDHSEAESNQNDGIAAISEKAAGLGIPSPVTIARRAKSYSDFYDAMKAQLKRGSEDGRNGKGSLSTEIKTELDFADWYRNFEFELEDSSNEEYR